MIPGFTVKEFILNLKKVKKGKGPQPFSSYPTITDVPFVSYVNFSEKEVKDAIDLLRKDGIIKVTNDVFTGEMRYDIADESLKRFVKDVWLVHDIDLRLLIERLVYNNKTIEKDKNRLTFFFGKKYADKILADIYHIKNSYNKENRSDDEKIAKDFMQDFDNYRRSLVQNIIETHEKVIEEYEIASELTEGICYSPLFSEETSEN